MSQRQPLVHPFTFLLTNWIGEAVAQVNLGVPHCRDSIKVLYWLAISLDSKGQQTLEKEIKQMEAAIDGQTAITVDSYRELYKKVMKELHAEGYFLAAKMRPPTREASMKDLELKIAEAKYGKKE